MSNLSLSMRGASSLAVICPRATRGVATQTTRPKTRSRSNIFDLPSTDPDGRPTQLSKNRPPKGPGAKTTKRRPKPALDVWTLLAQSPIRQCVVTRQKLPNSFLICLKPVVFHEIDTDDIDGSVARADAAEASGEVSLRLAPAHILFEKRDLWQGFDDKAGEQEAPPEESSSSETKEEEGEFEVEEELRLRHPGLVRLSGSAQQRGRSLWVTCRRDVVERLQEPGALSLSSPSSSSSSKTHAAAALRHTHTGRSFPGPHLRELASEAYKGLQVTPYLADQIQEQLETRVLDEFAHLAKKAYSRSLTQRDLKRPMPYEMIRRLPCSEVEEMLRGAEAQGPQTDTETTPERAFSGLRALEAKEAEEAGVGPLTEGKEKSGLGMGQGEEGGQEVGRAVNMGQAAQVELSETAPSNRPASLEAEQSKDTQPDIRHESESAATPDHPSASASSSSAASDAKTTSPDSTLGDLATVEPALVPRPLAILDLATLHRSIPERTTRPLPSIIPPPPTIVQRSRGPPVPIPSFNLAELFPETRHRATWKALQHLAQIGNNKRFLKYPGTGVVPHPERTTLMQFQTSLAVGRNDSWARVMRQNYLSATRALWRLKLWHGGGWER